ncbi:MAG TPA: hypothetical protein VIZ18_02870 [Ktedonobacteraceae bacterium]
MPLRLRDPTPHTCGQAGQRHPSRLRLPARTCMRKSRCTSYTPGEGGHMTNVNTDSIDQGLVLGNKALVTAG